MEIFAVKLFDEFVARGKKKKKKELIFVERKKMQQQEEYNAPFNRERQVISSLKARVTLPRRNTW